MQLAALELAGLVGLAGALGALARYLVGRFVAEKTTSSFPFGTLLINVTGAFVIGVLFSLTTKKLISSQMQAVLATGFLGGYTTFSTMSWEGVQLARGGSRRQSVLYLGGNLALGLPAAALGMMLGGLL
jgi:fluoride exporter